MQVDPSAAAKALAEGEGKGILIAILDTGLADSHPAFENATIEPQLSVSPDNTQLKSGTPDDPLGHGTAVTGIIHRIAPQARLLPIQVLNASHRGNRHELIKQGALEALAAGAHILNCSFGAPATTYSFALYKSWTDEAFDQGRHVVTAASNTDQKSPEWPSAFRTTLAVSHTSSDPHLLEHRAGSPIPFRANGIKVSVPSLNHGTSQLTGSSFAAAHLSGILARLLSASPKLSPSLAREALTLLAQP